ncbi:helix-turn-helix domain-containing protein [Cryptosporangium minutisporangium]|uniref:Helix-turn-helix domain-containing protein n=2 Tax=Cryptosporangium minutisporangium TaxID=113569 RepID=A0ABP6T9Z8_9ACTN
MERMAQFLCGLDAAVAVVGGKWKPLILWALSEQPRRTSELRRELPGISEKVLVQQLRELERDGVVEREIFTQVPPKVVYRLTDRGVHLDLALRPLGDWGEQNMATISAARAVG